MYLADALSHAFPSEIVHEQFEADIDSERLVHLMSTESYVTDRKLQAIRSEVSTDQRMVLLQRQIQTGWPEHKSLVPTDIHAYYQDRQELTMQDGLIYKAHNILILPKLHRDTLNKLHQSHQGMGKMKCLARESIYWPGMNTEIDDVVSPPVRRVKPRATPINARTCNLIPFPVDHGNRLEQTCSSGKVNLTSSSWTTTAVILK